MNCRPSIATAALVLTGLALTACSSKAAGGAAQSSGDVKTDVGVTDSDITLGVQTDMSGIFKAAGLAITHGDEIWADEINAAGGICGRKIKLDTVDIAYKAENAVPTYQTQKTKVLGLLQVIGAPAMAALKSQVTTDKVLTTASSPSSVNLDSPSILMVGTTYDVEMINGWSYLAKTGKVKDGDTVGHIYIDSEYGQNGLLGTKAYAKEHNLKVVEAALAGTDTDLTATITKLKSEGVTAIAITTAPAAAASAAIQMKTQGLQVPLLASAGSFAPSMLADDTAAGALAERATVMNSNAPYSADLPAAKKIRDEYAKKGFTDQPSTYVPYGYTAGRVWQAILTQACGDGDLTRQGILDAKAKVTNLKTEGLTGDLDYSVPGAPATRESYVLGVDKSAEGGLKIIEDKSASAEAKKYRAPYQK
ncbi:ABC transporter substrate-binding protein [Cumulibacter manganitolerans]|uniref:ABC transporter substrate-binding protein n=1 Tax=Cumulibacter manganitolerans TaxID=1884992 RepID=UPI0012964D25|nr:ABC transporter substrate-binding protein [Cumulibacter manganitolerans]